MSRLLLLSLIRPHLTHDLTLRFRGRRWPITCIGTKCDSGPKGNRTPGWLCYAFDAFNGDRFGNKFAIGAKSFLFWKPRAPFDRDCLITLQPWQATVCSHFCMAQTFRVIGITSTTNIQFHSAK